MTDRAEMRESAIDSLPSEAGDNRPILAAPENPTSCPLEET